MVRRRGRELELLPRAIQALVQRHADSPAALWGWIERLQDARELQGTVAVPRQGVVATPARVARLMAERLLRGPHGNRPLRLLDAGCGSGRLLTAALREASRRRLRLGCEGVETDAAAARWAQALEEVHRAAGAALVGWKILHADFLLDYAPPSHFDLCIANPPWVAARALSAGYRRKLHSHLRGMGRADLSALFVERLLEVLRPGGRLCVIVPNKLLASDYATALRHRLLQDFRLEEVWDLAGDGVFSAHAAYPVILVVAHRRPAAGDTVAVHHGGGAVRTRWPQEALLALPRHVVPLDLPADSWPLLRRLLAGPRLGDAVPVGCGLAVPGFQRAMDRGRDHIICSGDIRPFRVRGRRRFAPQQLDLGRRTLARQKVPKVVIPGMFRRLHAAFDARGDLLGRVYFVPVSGRADSRRALLLALLNSRLYAVLYRGLFGGVAQSGGYLRLNAPYLRRLPWPQRAPSAALLRLVQEIERSGAPESGRARLDRGVEDLFGLAAPERRLVARLERRLHPGPSGSPRTARRLSRLSGSAPEVAPS